MSDTLSVAINLRNMVAGKLYSRANRTFTGDLFLVRLCLHLPSWVHRLAAEGENPEQEQLTLGETLEESCS